jgi:hypothetical protein
LGASFGSESLEALSSLVEKILGDGEIHGCRIGIDVPKESSEVHKPAVGVNAFTVPAK